MKKLFILFVGLLLICTSAYAAEIEDSITLQWDWDGPTPEGTGLATDDPIANDLEWHLFKRYEDTAYNYSSPALIEQYEGDLSLEYNIILDSLEDGETVRFYFVLRAYYDGRESDSSNEVFIDLTANAEPINTSPTNLRIVSIDTHNGDIEYHFNCNDNTDNQSPSVGTGNIQIVGDLSISNMGCGGGYGLLIDDIGKSIWSVLPSGSVSKFAMVIKFQSTTGRGSTARIFSSSGLELRRYSDSNTTFKWHQLGVVDWDISDLTIDIWDGICHTIEVRYDSINNNRYLLIDNIIQVSDEITEIPDMDWSNSYWGNAATLDKPIGGIIEDIKIYNNW